MKSSPRTRTFRSFSSSSLLFGIATLGLLSVGAAELFSNAPPCTTQPGAQPQLAEMGRASLGDLNSTYARWAEKYRQTNPKGPIVALAWNRGMSAEYSKARGIAQINLQRRSISVRIKGLKDQGIREVWLLDNTPGENKSTLPEAGDRLIHAGRLRFKEGGIAWLDADIDELGSLRLDSVIIARSGQELQRDAVLYGNTSLFQKAFHYPVSSRAVHASRSRLIPKAHASGLTPPGYSHTFSAELLNEGRRLFFNEDFNGNGRNCGTCHHEDDNLALSLRTIASLPSDDPLFIVEQEYRRDGTRNALYQDYRMERPELMRKAGLILENVDGFRESDGSFTRRAVMRAPNHLLSVRTTVAPPPAYANDGTLPVDPDRILFAQRTGWSGDGSPTDFGGEFFQSNGRELTGSLRDFTVGAIRQHFTRTLERSSLSRDGEGNARTPDFRMPTEAELDALEAFMLSTGIQKDREDLKQVRLLDEIAERGRRNYLGFNVFDATPDDGRPPLNCQACHFNGGANTNPVFPFPAAVTPNHDLADLAENGGSIPSHNRSFGPGVERLADQAADIIAQVSSAPSVAGNCSKQGLAAIPLLPNEEAGVPSEGCDANPFDDGFLGGLGQEEVQAPFLANRFNVPPVFEAMDTPPFFHGHQINTIEGMVAFYASSRHFRNGDFAGPIVPLNAPQVVNVARFLRVMGADFNAESAIELLIKAAALSEDQGDARAYNIYLAQAEIEDAIGLLNGADVHFSDVVPLLERASITLQTQCGAGPSRRHTHRGYPSMHQDRQHAAQNSGPSQRVILEVLTQLREAQAMMVERSSTPDDDRARIARLRESAKGYIAPITPDIKNALRKLRR